MRILHWFRTDLRVHDNTALAAAFKDADKGVAAVFVVTPEQWREHDWGNPKVDFTIRTLAALRERLDELNVPLKIVTVAGFAETPEAIVSVAKEVEADAVYFNRENEINERKRDEAVADALEADGRSAKAFLDKTGFEPGSVRTKTDGWYTVFSPFKRAWKSRYMDGDRPAVSPTPKKQDPLGIDSDEVPMSVDGYTIGVEDRELGIRPDLWGAGERVALGKLGAFIQHKLDDYKDARNFPADPATSVMSPYLAVGSISPRVCMEKAIEANNGRIDKGGKGAVHWIDELLWREFYQHLLIGFPRLCKNRAFRPEFDSVEWNRDEAQFDRWKEGRTGFPIVDAGMRQLNTTGWMHNRVRMIVAMFLTKDLMIDWRWGEKYFMQRLIDGDLASNNGGWQWSASTGTDAQPYFRIFNPYLQSKRFDADGAYIRRFVPELAGVEGDAVHEPHEAGLFGDLDYPEPMVDHSEARDRAIEAFKAAGGKPGPKSDND